MCGFLPLIAIVKNWVCGVVKDLMTTMLTVNFVIVSFFVTTLEKHRYCNMPGKQSMFRGPLLEA